MTTVLATHERYVEHDLQGHPEHAGRIRAIWERLKVSGLTEQMEQITPQMVTDEQILAVHTQRYLEAFNLVAHEQGMVRFDSDTYAFPESPEIARLSAGGVVAVVDAILNDEANNGLALVRPPGHHAIPTRAMGFCLLGNIAIGAKHAINAHKLRHVMIVDFDVHHGNGTQDMLYGDDNVLFISLHQYPFYPGSGGINETGKGRGRGFTLNIPLKNGHGDNNYARLFEEIIWERAREFEPDIIMVSAGFDAHWIDPLASMNLSLTGYAHITQQLIDMAEEFCDGKIAFVLEGGYDLQALSYGIANVAHALINDGKIDDPLGTKNSSEPDIEPLIHQLKKLHKL